MTERLTEAERESFLPWVRFTAADGRTSVTTRTDEEIVAAVESIIAARESALRESIAQEIEAACEHSMVDNICSACRDDARIARGGNR